MLCHHSLDISVLNIHEIWRLKLFYSGSPKFMFWCMTVQTSIPEIFPQIVTVVSTVYPLERLSFPDHVHNFSQAWVVSTCECLACSRLQVGSKIHLSWTFLFLFQKKNFMPSEWWQPIPQTWSYVYLMSLEYFSIFLSGQEQIISNAVMSWLCIIWGCQIITHFTCETCAKAIAWGSPFYSQLMSLNPYR